MQVKEFEGWNLSTEALIVASYLILLKVIEINNIAIQQQLGKAGISIWLPVPLNPPSTGDLHLS